MTKVGSRSSRRASRSPRVASTTTRRTARCPPAKGVAQKGGRRVPGVYSPFSNRAVTADKGLNTVTLAATGRKGKTLKPGTYLLTITAGDVSVRTKMWVLGQ